MMLPWTTPTLITALSWIAGAEERWSGCSAPARRSLRTPGEEPRRRRWILCSREGRLRLSLTRHRSPATLLNKFDNLSKLLKRVANREDFGGLKGSASTRDVLFGAASFRGHFCFGFFRSKSRMERPRLDK